MNRVLDTRVGLRLCLLVRMLTVICELKVHPSACAQAWSLNTVDASMSAIFVCAGSAIVRVRNSRGGDHRAVQGGGIGQCVELEPLLLTDRPVAHARPVLSRCRPRVAPVGGHTPGAARCVSAGWRVQGGCRFQVIGHCECATSLRGHVFAIAWASTSGGTGRRPSTSHWHGHEGSAHFTFDRRSSMRDRCAANIYFFLDRT